MDENAVCKGRKCFFTKASIDRLGHYVYNIHNLSLIHISHREKLRPANEIAKMLIDEILSDLDYKGRDVVVMVNGMGGTPLMELYIVNNFVQDYLKEQGVHVYDTMVGNYMTSIEMAGFSLTLLRLDDDMKALYDAPADTLAWKK